MDRPDTTDLGRELAKRAARGRLKRNRQEHKEQERLPAFLRETWMDAKAQAFLLCDRNATGCFNWQIDIAECNFEVFKPTARQIFKALPDEIREMAECNDEDFDVYIETGADEKSFAVKFVYEKAIGGAMHDLTKEEGLSAATAGAPAAAED